MHLLPFLLRAQAVLRRHISAFFSGKIPSNVAARLTRKYWVPNFRHFVTIPPPPPSTLICHYLLLFVTIRDYSPLFALFVLFVTASWNKGIEEARHRAKFGRYKTQVTGHRAQVTGHRSQVTGHCFTYKESILNIHKS